MRKFNKYFILQQVETRLSYKYVTTYRQVMIMPRIDFCAIAKESFDNKLIAVVVQIIRDTAPELIDCPLKVREHTLKFL